MHDSLDLNSLVEEAKARVVLRRNVNIALGVAFALTFVAMLIDTGDRSTSSTLSVLIFLMVPALVFGWLFSLSNIGWGLILYFFRPGHELLRQFPPIRIDWRPWMSIGIFILVFAIFLTGVAFNAIVL